MDSFNRRSSKGASLASVYRLDTGLVKNAPNASLSPGLWMLSSCRRLVFDAVPYTMQPKSHLERTMAWYSIKSLSLCPPYFKWATTRMRLRASLHCVFSTPMCFLIERCESHHSPRNFVDSSTEVWFQSSQWGVSEPGTVVQWNVWLCTCGLQTWNHSMSLGMIWMLQQFNGATAKCLS